MMRRESKSLFLVWSTMVALTLAACGSSGSGAEGSGGEQGSGGHQSASGGAVGTGGTASGSGGAAASSGGATGSGGKTGSGGASSASGGITGSGGASTGSGGKVGSGGTAPGSGGAAAGTGGAGGKMAGSGGSGTASGGNGGSGARGGTMGSGSGGTAGAGSGGATGGGSGTTPGMSAGCGKPPTIASSNYNNGHHITITAANMQREYILNVPTNYDNTHPYLFIIAYHKLNGNDDKMYKNQYYHLLPLSNNSTIFVAPNGQQNNANCTQASGCGWPNPSGSDMALADAVVKQIEDNFCIDTNRVFATGWSYGASMSYETACERPLGTTTGGMPGFIRGIAVYSAMQLSGSCKPSKQVAYYASHGTNDTVLCYDSSTNKGGACIGNGGVGLFQNFATVNACTWMTPTKVTSGNHVCTNLMGCATGYPAEFCSFNGPHTPDPSDGGGGSWEYQNAWNFLSQF